MYSKEASKLKASYVTAKEDMIGLRKTVAKEDGVSCNVFCTGFVRTPLAERQIPERSKTLPSQRQRRLKTSCLKKR